jgi:N-acetylglucosaminyldiphosphoundecaprenol N-acetyl-beta-D-mannosaminyltransferase
MNVIAETTPRLRTTSRTFNVLGVEIAAVQIPDVISLVEHWIASGARGKYVAAANVHMVIEATQDRSFATVLEGASLVAPDGMPLIWAGRMHGHSLERRVYGPDLMIEFLRQTQDKNYRHFFYGGAPGVADKLVSNLQSTLRLNCVGTLSPPFRKLSPQEDGELVHAINSVRPDVVWVCLGCPKQERWMHDHADSISAPVMIGVGQAFDIYAGTLRQAPAFMRDRGLEWLFRLCIEPRRLWRRYLVYNTKFLFYSLLQRFGLRRF